MTVLSPGCQPWRSKRPSVEKVQVPATPSTSSSAAASRPSSPSVPLAVDPGAAGPSVGNRGPLPHDDVHAAIGSVGNRLGRHEHTGRGRHAGDGEGARKARPPVPVEAAGVAQGPPERPELLEGGVEGLTHQVQRHVVDRSQRRSVEGPSSATRRGRHPALPEQHPRKQVLLGHVVELVPGVVRPMLGRICDLGEGEEPDADLGHGQQSSTTALTAPTRRPLGGKTRTMSAPARSRPALPVGGVIIVTLAVVAGACSSNPSPPRSGAEHPSATAATSAPRELLDVGDCHHDSGVERVVATYGGSFSRTSPTHRSRLRTRAQRGVDVAGGRRARLRRTPALQGPGLRGGSASEWSALKVPGSPSTTELTSSSTRTELTYPGRKCKTRTCSGSTFKFTIRACGNSVCAEAMWKGRKQIVIRCTKLKHLFISHLFSQWYFYFLIQSPLREGKLF